MNRPDLQKFTRQLAAWTEVVIDNGRTPFRKVTVYTPLQTGQGLLNPPLIFWINRQSMMAGGLLLLPERDLEEELARGRSCAEALALRHFVTWETDRIRIWQLEKQQISQYREINIGPVDHPDRFRQLLNELLETIKLLAVLGAVPAAELSVHYLHNLFLTTLELSFPALLDSCRSLRALDNVHSPDDAKQQATEINRLILLQLLALLWHRKLPKTILPEKLNRAIQLSLPELPPPLQQGLAKTLTTDPLELPHESSVCFHHLLLRLRQLSWDQPHERASHSLRLLIENWYPQDTSPQPPAPVQVYPPGTVSAREVRQVLFSSAVQLAAQALLDDLLQQPGRQLYFGNLFQFGAAPLPGDVIVARLLDRRRPTRDERHQYAALLRTSWPNRRFRISGDRPLWLWEILHLLGLCAAQQQLLLTLVPKALRTPASDPFWTLLREHFRIDAIQQLADGSLLLKVCRDEGSEQAITISTAESSRRATPVARIAPLRAQILLALALPDQLFSLIDNEFIWPDEETAGSIPPAGLAYYAQSRLGRLTWELICDGPLPDAVGELRHQLVETGWPVPDPKLLTELEKRLQNSGLTAQASPDQLLAEFWQCPAVATVAMAASRPAPTYSGKRAVADKDLKREILAQLSAEGIPVFPEQYLYFLEAPEMSRYCMTPPLHKVSEFLGQFELCDAAGRIIQGYGDELAEVLLLCGELGRQEVDLPAAREQLTLLLDHYYQDLRNLLKQLKQLCHSRLESKAAARKMAHKIWKDLPLPTEKWFAD